MVILAIIALFIKAFFQLITSDTTTLTLFLLCVVLVGGIIMIIREFS